MTVFAMIGKTEGFSPTLSIDILHVKIDFRFKKTRETSRTLNSIPPAELNPRKECKPTNQTSSVEDTAR